MDTPYLRLEDTGEVFEMRGDITTVGRGDGVDGYAWTRPSMLPAARGVGAPRTARVRDRPRPLLERNTRERQADGSQRVFSDGDVLSFGAARLRVGGLGGSSTPRMTPSSCAG